MALSIVFRLTSSAAMAKSCVCLLPIEVFPSFRQQFPSYALISREETLYPAGEEIPEIFIDGKPDNLVN